MTPPAGDESDRPEILVVEDSATQALKLAHVLRDGGYAVSVAADGQEALGVLATRRPALIVSDIVMPNMDGYELCRRIKADPGACDIPVLLLTSLSDPHDVLRGLEAGADSFATKPYGEARLLARIRNILLNRERWRAGATGAESGVYFAGQEHRVAAGAHEILEFLLYTYEDAVEKNLDLIGARDELARSNLALERKAAELSAINGELESFAYSVSHDLRAPLRRIDGFGRMLAEECAGQLGATGLAYLDRLRASCVRMGQLIEDLLTLSRASRGELNRTVVDASEMARSVAADLQRDEPGRAVTVVIEPGVRAECDERLLRILLVNLLGNAWKFTGRTAEARIEFGRTRAGGREVLFVRDNGVGFDMGSAARLFGAFQRLHSESEFPGTGIGLATVQRIVRRHGGDIRAESAVGQGAAFYFTFG